MATSVDKASKITKFITDVVTPATSSIATHLGNSSSLPGGVPVGSSPLITSSQFSVNPNSFNVIDPAGGIITASDLADLFQYYAYCLTSIRRANIQRITASNSAPSFPDERLNTVTALSAEFRMSQADFKAAVTSGSNPLINLQPGNVASSSALDELIAKLASVVSTFRSGTAVNISICHAACHGSRGRR